MKTAIGIGSAYYNGEDWDQLVDYTVEADRIGVDHVWSAEAWGMDAVVPLAYIAARTQRIILGTGIIQISARVPAMIAMTAQSLATVSNNRFVLGLGVSGPQVVEGLHGAAFAHPLGRLRSVWISFAWVSTVSVCNIMASTMSCRAPAVRARRFGCPSRQDRICPFIWRRSGPSLWR